MSDDLPPSYVARLAAKQGDTDYLIGALTDPEIGGSAAYQLGKLGEKAAVPQLIRNLEIADDLDRGATIKALGRIGDPAAIPALVEVARADKAAALRASAIFTLARLGSAEGVGMLAQLAIDPRPLLAGCVRSFAHFGERWMGPRGLRRTRRKAVAELRELRASDAIPTLVAGLETVDLRHRIRLRQTIRSLQRNR